MMMAANPDSPLDLVTAVLPPELYFRVASQILKLARGLFLRGVVGASSLQSALRLANRLSRAGMSSWRVRRRHR